MGKLHFQGKISDQLFLHLNFISSFKGFWQEILGVVFAGDQEFAVVLVGSVGAVDEGVALPAELDAVAVVAREAVREAVGERHGVRLAVREAAYPLGGIIRILRDEMTFESCSDKSKQEKSYHRCPDLSADRKQSCDRS